MSDIKGAITFTSKIKHALKLKTSPARYVCMQYRPIYVLYYNTYIGLYCIHTYLDNCEKLLCASLSAV